MNMRNIVSTIIMAAILAACIKTPLVTTPTPTPPPAPTATTAPQTSATVEPTTASTAVEPAQPGSITGLEPGWWNDAIFYEIFVRSFKDSNGDGVGDFNGVTEMLDYLNDGDPDTTTDLGVTGIWLMPIMESPSYHGYDVENYYQTDQEYGTKEDFLRMVDEAHRRGIRVIVDLVINHSAITNPWFLASDAGDTQYRDWYIWEDQDPGYLGPWGQKVWYAGKNGYYYAVFWSGMPDLNLKNPQVTEELYNVTEFWLKDMNVDGFRLDAIRHYVENGRAQENTKDTHAWLQGFYKFYKSMDSSIFTVGEAWTETAEVVDYTGDEVDIAFEFDLAGDFVRAAQGPIASAASKQLDTALQSYPKGQYGVFLTNHDQNRVMSVLEGDVTKAKLAAVMLLTSPGVPFIYYGEEIGMTGTKPDEDIRLPMQWTGDAPGVGFTTGTPWRAAAADFAETNVTQQTDDPGSLLNLYRTLAHLRNDHAALRTGDTLIIDPGTQRLYAILRYDESEAFLILVNPYPKALPTNLYSLSLDQGPFKGEIKIETVIGLENAVLPQINSTGGFEEYYPFNEIPSDTATILHITY